MAWARIGIVSQRSGSFAWTSTDVSPSSGTVVTDYYDGNTYGGYVNQSDQGAVLLPEIDIPDYDGGGITAPSFTGFHFSGWYSYSGEVPFGSPVKLDNATVSISSNRTVQYSTILSAAGTYRIRSEIFFYMVYPKWAVNTYTVKFNANGGSGTMADESFKYGTAKALSANAFTRTGYTFAGWNTKTNGTGTAYSNGQSVKNLSSTNGATVNLYAQWTANTYAVALDRQSGTGGSTSVTATYGSAMPTATMPTLTGYTFGGYFTETNGGGTQYYNSDGSSARSWDRTEATTLYAKWTIITSAVTLDRQSGTGGTASVTATYGSAMPSITPPTRTGYTFGGYFTETNGGGTQYYTSSGASARAWDKTTATTLYAKWTVNTYTIRFDANRGSGGVTLTLEYGAALTPPAVTRTGYTFSGWVPSVPETVPANPPSAYTAQWTENSYTVEYYDGQDFLASDEHLYSASFTPLTPIPPSGRSFAGWNTKDDGTGTTYSDAQAVSGLSSVDGAVVRFYAMWTVNTYTLTFEVQGGTDGTRSATVAATDVAMPSITVPTRTGYTFMGYFEQTGGTGRQYYDANGTGTRTPDLTADKTLYAYWTINGYAVTYNPGAYGTGAVQTATKVHNETLYLLGPIFSRGGYSQTGWTTVDGGAKSHDLYGSYVANAAATFYPFWTANDYEVTLDRQGGTGGTASVTATYGSAMPSITPPTRTGYAFGGYFTAQDGGGTQYYDASGASARSSALTTATTLYAKWIANHYSVKFVYHAGKDDGSGAVNFGVEFPVEAPTREGYYFRGWMVTDGLDSATAKWGTQSGSVNSRITYSDTLCGNGAGGTVYFKDLTPEPNALVTLTAQWTEETPAVIVVTFDETGGSDVGDMAVEEGASLELPATARYGYSFDGWYTSSEGGVRIGGAGDSYAPTADITLYAVWSRKTNTATIRVVDESGAEIAVSGVDSVVGCAPSGTKSGMSIAFNDGETILFTPVEALSVGGVERRLRSVTSGGSVVWAEGSGATDWNSVMDANREFVLRYSRFFRVDVGPVSGDESSGAVSVTGTFDIGGSSFAYAGENVRLSASAVSGYAFAGWFRAQDGGGSPIQGWGAARDIPVTGEIHAYAKFSEVRDADSICEWEGGDARKEMVWRSKTYVSSKPFSPSACRVDALGYPPSPGRSLALTVDMFSAPDSAATATTTLSNIASQDARRLPVRRTERYMQVEVRTNAEVDAVLVGTSMGGLAL